MGLQEKQIQNALETETIPKITEEMNGVTGGSVTVNVDWATFTTKEALQEIEYQVLGRVMEAVRNLCGDDFTKGVVAESFKAINVKNLDSNDNKSVSFADNALNIEANWADYSNIHTAGDIKSAFENGL